MGGACTRVAGQAGGGGGGADRGVGVWGEHALELQVVCGCVSM